MAGDCNFNQNLWSFDVLAIPEIRNIAASAAAVANIVILSMSGKKKLPAKVKEWIETWVWLIDRAHPVLVALFDSQNGERVSIRAYLRNIAESKHIDFFPDTCFSMPQHH
jgi:site-specific recombinase XerC